MLLLTTDPECCRAALCGIMLCYGAPGFSTCVALRSADSALRRSIPAFNKDVREVQTKLEDVAFKLRIPQRKPWPAMVDDVRAASAIVAQPDRVSLHCCTYRMPPI